MHVKNTGEGHDKTTLGTVSKSAVMKYAVIIINGGGGGGTLEKYKRRQEELPVLEYRCKWDKY